MTVVKDEQDASAETAAGVIKRRGSRRPRVNLDQEREIARLYADTGTSTAEICARLGIGESTLYRIVQRLGIPLRGRTASSTAPGATQPAPARPTSRKRSSNAGRQSDSAAATGGGPVADQAIESEVKQTPPEPTAQPMVAQIADGGKSITRRRRTVRGARSSELRQFVVSFMAEQILEAASAFDALQQAQARGATEVISIVRTT